MLQEVAEHAVIYIAKISRNLDKKHVSITFHGGEPLLAPFGIWEYLLKELSNALYKYKLHFSVQSNLWAFDDNFARLFKKYKVSIGTSIDGPKELCDLSRGEGYWDQTMAGIKKAREYGIDVGGIATLTNDTHTKWKEFVEFYIQNNMNMNLHPAVSSLNGNNCNDFRLDSEHYGNMLLDMFPDYIINRKRISISTLDNFCKGCATGDPEVCTYRDCFGMFLAIGPDGSIYPCQRFCGNSEYMLGNVFSMPTLQDIYNHPNAQKMLAREKLVSERCSECEVYNICKGGCYYNALAGGDGIIDPLCDAYKRVFGFVREKLTEEMASEENINAIAENPPKADEHPLLRSGKYISLSKKHHPRQIADNARTILGLNYLAKTDDPGKAAELMNANKVSGDIVQTEFLLKKYHENLQKPTQGLFKLFAHITFRCNLACKHCYAVDGDNSAVMDTHLYERLLNEGLEAGFPKFIVTGGEPLQHPELSKIAEITAKYRMRGMKLTLRTNFFGDFAAEFFEMIGAAFDKIVVSIDGTEDMHDDRRGKGTYRKSVANIRQYLELRSANSSMSVLGLASILRSDDINGEAGWSVRDLASKLGITRVKFRPILPLGRAANWDEPLMAEGLQQHVSSKEMLESDFHPLTSCGIGQNLYIEPDGKTYPCYAYHRPHTLLGNASEIHLSTILSSDKFRLLQNCTVNTMDKCRDCEYRYLCGGACRAWGDETNQDDLFAAPPNCDHLKKRAEKLVEASFEYLEIK